MTPMVRRREFDAPYRVIFLVTTAAPAEAPRLSDSSRGRSTGDVSYSCVFIHISANLEIFEIQS